MATDTNKKSASGNTDITSTAKVGDGGKTTRARKLPTRSIGGKKLFVAFLLVAVVLAGGWAVLSSKLHVGQKVYAQAAGHKIYKQDVKNLIGKNKGISEHNAAAALADKYLTEALAKEQKITVTNKDIDSAYGTTINKQKTSNQYSYQYQVNQLYFNKLRDQNQGVYKGELLVTQFSRYIAYQSPLLQEQKAEDPNIGNTAAIAADKQHAQNLINSLYNQIKSGQITFDQAIQTEHDDPIVGEKAYPTLSHSGAFDTSSPYITRNGLLKVGSIKQQIRDIKPGQTSKPFVVRVSNSISDDSTAESYFLVVRMESSSGGQNNASFEQYLAQAKQRLGYKVYV